jgi:hypothetical protein
MFKSALIKKSITAAAVVITAVILTLPAYSQESLVNSTDTSLILYGGLGYGDTSYGSSEGDDLTEITGVADGPSVILNAGTLFSWSIVGAGLSFSGATFNDMKSDVSKTYGDGNFWTVDATLGLKLFTEAADMGYTYFYGGLKYWKATRNVDYEVFEGVRFDEDEKSELSGKGWSIGFKDYSTYPVGSVSIVLQTGIMLYSAPIDTMKVDGDKISFSKGDDAGQVLEIGIGLAFEDIGLSVIAGVKDEYNASAYKIEGAGETRVFGLGYTSYFVNLTKDFSI